jgi:hypothetical protein
VFSLRKAAWVLLALAATALSSLASAPPSFAATTLGPYVIQNTASKLCVQPDPNNPGPDIQLVQDSCANTNLIYWTFVPFNNTDTSGNYWIKNRGINQSVGTGNCMRARADRDFSPVESIDCTSISDLKWQLLVAPSGGHLELISKVSGGSRCLDVLDNALTRTTMDIFHCSSNSSNTNTAQTFYVQPQPVP